MTRNGRNPKSPAFQWYPGDFLADPVVQAMTALERGVFITLISAQWLDGPLPNDPPFLARVCKLTDEEFADAWKMVGRKFHEIDGDRLANPRLEREREFQQEGKKRLDEGAAKAREAKQAKSEAEARNVAEGVKTLDQPCAKAEANSGPGLEPAPPLSPIPDSLSPKPVYSSAPPAAPRPKKRKEPTGERAEAVRAWEEVFKTETARVYPFGGKKDGAHVKALLSKPDFDVNELRRRATRLLRDEFWAEKGVDLGTLVARWAALAAAGRTVDTNAPPSPKVPTRAELDEAARGLKDESGLVRASALSRVRSWGMTEELVLAEVAS
jgi:uncharacterized protein YdaU (DUF1376 family)